MMKDKREKSKSLIMCSNPLQMLIAEKIIELNRDQIFDLLTISQNDNVKYRHYHNRLKKECANSMFYKKNSGFKDFVKFSISIKSSDLNKKYKHIYLASIDVRFFQYMISKNIHANIYTFDDGLANIVKSGLYHSTLRKNYLKKLIWSMLGVKVDMDDIKNRSILHFTIYKNLPNIIRNIRNIELFEKKFDSSVKVNETVKIFLGQPLKSISDHYDSKYILGIMEKLDINIYYPHPKEKEIITLGKNINIIDSILIFEDYVMEFLSNNLDKEIIVYSFSSSCILNLANTSRVKVFFIHDSCLYENLKDFYDQMSKMFDIPHLSVN